MYIIKAETPDILNEPLLLDRYRMLRLSNA
jgi:hypothetical protein